MMATRRYFPDNYINGSSFSVPDNEIVQRYILEHEPTCFKSKISADDFGPPDTSCTDDITTACQMDSTLLMQHKTEFLNISNFSILTKFGSAICIGTGASGTMVLAANKTSAELVAFKLQKVSSRTILQEFVMQSKAQQVLDDRVPKMMGIACLKATSNLTKNYNRLVLVSEYCSICKNVPVAMTLENALLLRDDGQMIMSKKQWGDFILAMMDDVSTLQTNNLYHLDLKPDNILIRLQNGTFQHVFIDYGLTKTGNGSQCSPMFNSPDPSRFPQIDPQLFTTSKPLPTSDVYSILYSIGFIGDSAGKDLATAAYYYRQTPPSKRWNFKRIRELLRKITISEDVQEELKELKRLCPERV